MSILNYVLADKEKKARLREGYADVLKRSNTYRLGAGIGNLAGDGLNRAGEAANYLVDSAGNIVVDGLNRAGEAAGYLAGEALDGGRRAIDVYNTTEDYLDEGLARVGDFFSPNRQQYVGPMGRPHDTAGGTGSYDANMPGTMMVQDNFVPISGDDREYYQEQDTGNILYNPHFFESQNNPHGAWSPDYIAKEKEIYQDYLEATDGYQDQKEHMQRIQYGLGTLYPGEAADRYYQDKHNASRDRHREGMASGAYKAWANQTGRGLISGHMIGEDMNTHGGIHPVLKADWDAEMAGTRDYRYDYQPWKADNRSDWQKWKDSTKSGRR